MSTDIKAENGDTEKVVAMDDDELQLVNTL